MNEKSNSDKDVLSLLNIEIKRIMERRPPNEEIIAFNLIDNTEEE